MAPTSKEALAHLLENVLQFTADDIVALRTKMGLNYMRNFSRNSYDEFTKRKTAGEITTVCWQEITDFQLYYASVTPTLTTTQIMAMTTEIWDTVDINILRTNRALSETTLSTTAEPVITALTVLHTQINADSFIKYCNVKLPDKSGIPKFYDNVVSQATRNNVCIRPSSELTKTEGVKPDGMQPRAEAIMSTALHSKFSQDGVIDSTYKAAHNLLATTTSGYVFLQLLQQQSHPLLQIKSIATIDIPKYSDFGDLYRYAREITVYVESHALKQRVYSDKEITHIFLSHLDDAHYATAVTQIEGEIQLATDVATIYQVPAIAGTLDQLAPKTSRKDHTHRPRHNDQIRVTMAYYDNDSQGMFDHDDYCTFIDASGKSPHIRSFRDGGGRSPRSRGYGRGRGNRNRQGGRQGRGRLRQQQDFKGKWNACGLSNHHASACYFLLKLKQALTYLGVDPDAVFKKQQNFKGKNSYAANRSYVRSLMDAGFIPYGRADEGNFVDVVDGDHSVFTPDIINSITDEEIYDDEFEEEGEEE